MRSRLVSFSFLVCFIVHYCIDHRDEGDSSTSSSTIASCLIAELYRLFDHHFHLKMVEFPLKIASNWLCSFLYFAPEQISGIATTYRYSRQDALAYYHAGANSHCNITRLLSTGRIACHCEFGHSSVEVNVFFQAGFFWLMLIGMLFSSSFFLLNFPLWVPATTLLIYSLIDFLWKIQSTYFEKQTIFFPDLVRFE